MHARPNDNIIFEDSNSESRANDILSGSTLPPFPRLNLKEALRMSPDELNSLMYDDGPRGYVYDKPETPFEETPKDTNNNNAFEGYFYDKPSNPMVLPTTTTTTEEPDIDLPDGSARILRRR